MSLLMTSKKLNMCGLLTEKEMDSERMFEIRVRHIKNNESKSFSISMKKGVKKSDLPSPEQIKDFFENVWIKERKKNEKE